MGGFVLGQVSALSPDYEKAKLAAARLFKIFDRKSAIDSSSEDGLRPVRILSICVDYVFSEANAEENKTLSLLRTFRQLNCVVITDIVPRTLYQNLRCLI